MRLATALVPVRATPGAKRRLAHVLAPGGRIALVCKLLEHVVSTLDAAGLRVIVLSPSPIAVDAEVWTDAATGLNRALHAAVGRIGGPALIVHADLPFLSARDVYDVLDRDADVVVARARDGGTNGLLLPAAMPLAFGPGSAVAHAARARSLGYRTAVVDVEGFAVDVDDGAALTASGYKPS